MGKRQNGEGSYGEKIIKDVKYKYYRDANGKYTYAKTTKELKQKLLNKKEEQKIIKEENPVTNRQYTFGDFCDIWISTIDVEAGTYDAYESVIKNRIKEFKKYDLSNHQLRSITVDNINDYFKALAKKYSKGSVDKTWTVIRQVLDYGMEQNLIPTLNLKKIKIPRESEVAIKKKIINFITEYDMEQLYKESNRLTSRGTRYYGDAARVVDFIMYSGLRVGEAIALKWSNVAYDMSSITVYTSQRRVIARNEDGSAILNENGTMKHKTIRKDPKTASGYRSVPLPERAIEILKYFKDNTHSKEGYVFISNKGTPYNKDNIGNTLERMLKNSDCQCKEYTPHGLRHGYGSVLIRNGVDIKIVSELLGHTDVAFTYNVYIGILKEDKIKAVRDVFNNEIKDNQNRE